MSFKGGGIVSADQMNVSFGALVQNHMKQIAALESVKEFLSNLATSELKIAKILTEFEK